MEAMNPLVGRMSVMGDHSPKLAIGDRVRVSADWPHAPFRGAFGTVVEGAGLISPEYVWVEFDPPVLDDGECDAATFPPDALTKL